MFIRKIPAIFALMFLAALASPPAIAFSGIAGVRQIVNSPVPVQRMSDQQLRNSRGFLYQMINSGQLPPRLKTRAKARLRAIRLELKRRASAPRVQLPPQPQAGGGVNTREGEEAAREEQGANRNLSPARPVLPGFRKPAVLRDRRPSASLTRAQLRRRLGLLEQVIDSHGMPKVYKRQARAMRASDRNELARRMRAGQGNGNGGVVIPPANNRLIAVLRDRRPSASLTRAQLRRRLGLLEQIIDSHGMPNVYKRQARAMRARDRNELARRMRAGQGNGNGGIVIPPAGRAEAKARADFRLARSILDDPAPARRLSTAQLRIRTRQIRAILARRLVKPRLRRPLRQRLAVYSRELRARIAARRNRNNNGYTPPPAVPDYQPGRLGQVAQDLLADGRTSRQLTDRQLRARIGRARRVLRRVRLAPGQRRHITALIRADRGELRNRLIAARNERRRRLRRQSRNGTLNLNLYLNAPAQQGYVIPEAEADNDQIGGQLILPPRQLPPRRYTLEELRANPQLTRHIGGIDLDTINFGTNEYWVREEEIAKLERIGTAIERILAVRPWEVFQIEGHTDATGSDAYNLELSRLRAKAVAKALTEFFNIPAANLVTIGLGERYLKIPVEGPEPENRRVSIRRITPILQWER